MRADRTVEWFRPDGTELGGACHAAVPAGHGAAAVPAGHGAAAAAEAEGRRTGLTSVGAIQASAEELSFVSRRGMLPGTQVLLPAGVSFERAVRRMNRRHAELLGCEELLLPTVFDGSGLRMGELTRRFDDMGRTYRLADDPRAKLSYAADPNLFLWLQGQGVDLRGGPRFIHSPTLVHKRFRRGEVSMLNLREYLLPDVHALCTAGDLRTALSAVFSHAADGARVLVRDDWLVNADVTADLRGRWPDVGADLARWTGGHVRLATHPAMRGYMSLRAGVNASCGAGSVMLYNVQWDETNGPRFDIRDHRGRHVSVLHTTLLGGVSKALPLLLGRGLSGLRPRRLPVVLAPVQLHLVPVRPDHVGRARRLGHWLTDRGVRTRVVEPGGGSVGRRIAAIRHGWGQYVSVLGDDERDVTAVAVRDLSGRAHVGLAAFVRAVAVLETRSGARTAPR